MGLFDSFRKDKENKKGKHLASFGKTTKSFKERLQRLAIFKAVDEKFFEELLVVLLEADVGFTTADKIIANLKNTANNYVNVDFSFVLELLAKELLNIYQEKEDPALKENKEGPQIILFVGVNGSGKTTTLAKMAYLLKQEGLKVLAVAADTFRAAASNQLLDWCLKADIDCLVGADKADPASVVVDGCIKALKEGYDYILCDTAGRLQNKVNLMNELAKIKRVAEKQLGGDVVNSFLVIDATTGQNGISQASVFTESSNVNGLILTKIDGSAKGGIILAIKDQLGIPVRYVGSGETLDDLVLFSIEEFIKDLLGDIENGG